jgi:hypothetical protein
MQLLKRGKLKAKFSNLEITFFKVISSRHLSGFAGLRAAFLLLFFFAPTRGINPAKEK